MDLVLLIMFMEGSGRGGNRIMREQDTCMTGIFCKNQTNLTQHIQCPLTYIFEITDGRRHHIERSSVIIHGRCGYL